MDSIKTFKNEKYTLIHKKHIVPKNYIHNTKPTRLEQTRQLRPGGLIKSPSKSLVWPGILPWLAKSHMDYSARQGFRHY